MNEIKNLKPIDSTWRKIDDLFDFNDMNRANNSVREKYVNNTANVFESEFSERYPKYSDYFKAHANDAIYQYCLSVGQHRLEMMCRVADTETPQGSFFRTSPAHRVLLNLLCCHALRKFSDESAHVGVEVSIVKKAMSIYVSDRTSAAILAQAEDKGFIHRRMASWNRRIPLVFVTPAMLTDWISFQLTVCYNSAANSGLRETCEEISANKGSREETMEYIFKELQSLKALT